MPAPSPARVAFNLEYRALRMAFWEEATPNTPAGRAIAARRSEPFLPAYVGMFSRYTPNRYMRLLWERMDTCHG